MSRLRRNTALGLVCTAVACGVSLGGASTALAQNETAQLQGLVLGPNKTPLAGANITALDLNAGATRRASTDANGFYFIGGLVPSNYTVRVTAIGFAPQTDTLHVAVASRLRLDFTLTEAAATLQTVEVSASRNATAELRAPDVGSQISTEQIENLPQTDRNFLDLGHLAPGVAQPIPGQDDKALQAGAQSLDQVGVFIDGASFKNDILNGGIAGQSTSRGNPFPENAIQEFRISTNSFEAQYADASSALIVATTKEGGNEFHGGLFGYGETPWMIRRDFQTTIDGRRAPDFRRLQTGASIGGPIIKDKLHFFAAYEGNYRHTATNIIPGIDKSPVASGLNAQQYKASAIEPLNENLYFGKLSYNVADGHRLEVTQSYRRTTDLKGFGNTDGTAFAVRSQGQNQIDNLNTTTLRYLWSPGRWVNEAQVDVQYYKWNPQPVDISTPGQHFDPVIQLGGSSSYQNFASNRYGFHDDLTYSGFHALGDHVFKMGVLYTYEHNHIYKQLNYNPQFFYSPDASITVPTSAFFGAGNPSLSGDNGHVGVFLQDNWTVTRRLSLDLGVRWDYESNEFANNYKSPRGQEDSILALRDSLGRPMVSSRFFNNGGQRKPFYGAVQPRVSASYDLVGNGRTIIYGNWGIFYDRDAYYYMSNEAYNRQWTNYNFQFSADGAPRGTTPTIKWNPSYLSRQGLLGLISQGVAPPGQVYLNANDLRPPWSTNFSAGLRQSVGSYILSGTYLGSRGFNGFTYIWGNKDYTRRAQPFCFDPTCTASPQTFTQVLLSCGCIDSWYDAMILKAEKPLNPGSRWGGWVAYTLSWASKNGGDDIYSLDRERPSNYPRHPTPTDQRSIVQANGTVRLPLAFIFSGVVSLSSGSAYTVTNCQEHHDLVTNQCAIHYEALYVPKHDFLGINNAFAYYQTDVRLEKQIATFSGQRLGFVLDVFNVFDYANRACPATFIPDAGPQNTNFGELTCAGFNNQGRTFQAGVKYDF